MTPAAVPRGFRDTNRIFEEEVVGKEEVVGQGDFAALARIYTRDATILPAGAGMISGLDPIQESWKQAAATLGVKSLQLHGTGRAEIASVS